VSEDYNLAVVRAAMEAYDREQERLRQLMTDFTKRVNEDLDRLTLTRRDDADHTARTKQI
jgi:hypothetical protein